MVLGLGFGTVSAVSQVQSLVGELRPPEPPGMANIYIYTYIYICVCVCVYVCIYVYIYVCVCMYICIYICIYVYMYHSGTNMENGLQGPICGIPDCHSLGMIGCG